MNKKKYIILLSFDTVLGGAQIRYLSLFDAIAKKENDYDLIINRKLYEIAVKAGYFKEPNERISILEIDKYVANTNLHTPKQPGGLKRKSGIRVIISKLLTFYKLIKYTYKLHLIFKKNKPSYVYGIWIGGMISWPLKYMYKFKMVYSYMDSGFSSLAPFWDHPLKCERLPLRHADTIDFLSESLYHGVKKQINLRDKTKIAITPCSFKDYQNITPDKTKYSTISFSSRLTPIKNPLLFLQSIKEFNQIFPSPQKILFQILGDGACIEEMKRMVEREKLHNVELLGHVENPIEYLKSSAVFVSIQQTNNYPSQSLLEAMACENAVVASDVGETRKLVTEEEGVLVQLHPVQIAQAMATLLLNEEKRKRMGHNARKKVLAEHDIDRYLTYFYLLEKL